jgi:putative endonuclease
VQSKEASRRTGVRGETYAYWYLRRLVYVLVARNYMPRRVKGEIDMIGYHGETLAFVEVRTRTVRKEFTVLPELSVTREKQKLLARTAKLLLLERWVALCPCRFDVVAIDNEIGEPPGCDCIRIRSARKCNLGYVRPKNVHAALKELQSEKPAVQRARPRRRKSIFCGRSRLR